MDWSEYLQNVGKTLLDTGADVYRNKSATNSQIQLANTNNIAQLQALQMQMQYSPFGQPYIEGQPTMNGANTIPMSWLLIGGALLAVVLVKS